MRNIVYYVALSLDGYIEGQGGDISGYVSTGSGLEKYLSDLKDFDTVIMGRNTYEFGYQFGLQPGQRAYDHMRHYIFSKTLHFENPADGVEVCPLNLEKVQALKAEEGTDIYLCGGGIFAAWLLENNLIDIVKIKLSPVILGGGVRLFGNSNQKAKMELVEHEFHDHGLQIITYKVLNE